MPTKTPGKLYMIRKLSDLTCQFQVVQVDETQAESLRLRGIKVYNNSAQAHTVVRELVRELLRGTHERS